MNDHAPAIRTSVAPDPAFDGRLANNMWRCAVDDVYRPADDDPDVAVADTMLAVSMAAQTSMQAALDALLDGDAEVAVDVLTNAASVAQQLAETYHHRLHQRIAVWEAQTEHRQVATAALQ